MEQYLSPTFIFTIIIILPFYFWYVSIISRRNKCQEALAGIDVQLQKRFDLIPNILQIAKKFMEHEKSLMSEIVALRERVGQDYNKKDPSAVKQHFAELEQLSEKMSGFMVKVENYPVLKSDQVMIQSQQSYNEVESQIAAARRFYNSAANSLKNSIQIFPGNFIAKLISVNEMPFYQAEELSKKSVKASDFL